MLISPIFADQSNLLIPSQSKIIQFSELANQSTLNLIIAMYIFGITQISVGKKWGQVHFSGLSQPSFNNAPQLFMKSMSSCHGKSSL